MAIFLNILWEKFVGSARHSVEATAPINANTKYHIYETICFCQNQFKKATIESSSDKPIMVMATV